MTRFLAITVLFLSRLASSEPLFLTDKYERLDELRLRTSDLVDRIFLVERLDLELRFHESQALSEGVAKDCATLGEKGARDRLLACAVFRAERGDIQGSLAYFDEVVKRPEEPETVGDRLYAEGRIFLALPDSPPTPRSRAILAFQLLHRMHPDKTSPLFWISVGYDRVKNQTAFEEWKEKALQVGDARAALKYQRTYREQRLLTDGISSGFSPGLIASPGGGLGGVMRFHDDKLFDTDRKVGAGVFATTRGQWGANVQAEDFALLRGQGIRMEARLFRGEQDMFSPGPGSEPTSRFAPRVEREEGKISLVSPFFQAFQLEIGWQWFHQGATDDSGRLAALPDGESTYFSAPWFELAYDTRNSDIFASRGMRVGMSGAFPTRGLLSPRSFERWRFAGEFFFPGLKRGHVTSLHSLLSFVGGQESPWAAYPRFGGILRGGREGRWQDRALAGATGEYQFPVAFGLGLVGFATVASVGGNLGEAIGGIYEAGGGVGVFWEAPGARKSFWRIDLSRMGGETVLAAGGSVSL